MCSSLAELVAAVRDYSRGFDASGLTGSQAKAAAATAAVIEKMAAGIKAAAAARAADLGAYDGDSGRTPAHGLAKDAGSSVGEAREAIKTAHRLRKMPKLDEAVRQGAVSPRQAATIADAVEVDPEAEDRLVDSVGRLSFSELAEECARTKAAATDPEETHRRIHGERRARSYTDAEGGWNLHVRDTADAGAAIMAVLRGLADEAFNAARAAGRREPAEAYLADALGDMARRAAGAGKQTTPVKAHKIIVRVDWDALVRGWPIDGEVCEIAGLGPVPVSVVEALMASGDAFLAAVVTRGKDVVNVAHLGRRATAYQYSALQWRCPTCSVEGCNASLGVQVDHREDWAQTRITLLSLLDPLCVTHHRMKTHEGWGLVDGVGKRAFVGPRDPLHAKFARSEANANAPPSAAM